MARTVNPRPADPGRLLKPAGEDALIRWAGFKIGQRPKGGPAVWVRGHKMFDHKIALRIAERQWKQVEARLAGGEG
jgi:hypothetical protein